MNERHGRFTTPEEAGWSRLGPRTWRRPDGHIHEFPIGDNEVIVHLAPAILAHMAATEAWMKAISKEMKVMGNAIDEALAGMTDTIAQVVTAVHDETAKLATMASSPAPGSMSKEDVETSARKIAALNDGLKRVAEEARAALAPVPPAAPAEQPSTGL